MSRVKQKRFRKRLVKVWNIFVVRIIIYIIGTILCYGMGHVIYVVKTHVAEESLPALYSFLDFLQDKVTLSLFLGLIYAAVKAELKVRKASQDEEDLKTESDQHKIVRKYSGKNGHITGNLTQETNYFNYDGNMMQLHHIDQRGAKYLRPLSYDIFETSYQKEMESINVFRRVRQGDQNIPYLNIASLNIYTNYELNTELHIKDSQEMRNLPEFVIENSDLLIAAHSHSAVTNSTTVRLNDVAYNSDKHTITFNTQRSLYFNMLLTNRCMDFSLGGMTLRDVFEHHAKITPLKDSQLGNQIGVNGVIITDDGYLLVEHRGMSKTTWRDKFGQPISFGLKENELFGEGETKLLDNSNVEKKLMDTIRKSLLNNYGFVEGQDYAPISFKHNFMGLARDLLEGGKPNIYFYVVLKKNSREVCLDMQHYVSLSKEENGHKPIKTGKIKDSNYYLIHYRDIKINYDYELQLPKGSYFVGRYYKPRKRFSLANPLHVRRTKKYMVKQCGEALLCCLSYLEILQRKIPAINDVKVTAYGEFMVRHAISNCNSFEEFNPEKHRVTDTYGGTEANVCIGLESLGLDTHYATCFPKDNHYSEEALKLLREYSIDTSYIGASGDLFGEYSVLLDSNLERNLKTKFNRIGSAINTWDISHFDFDDFFLGAEIFHFTGIALSLDQDKNSTKNAKKFVNEAKKRNILVSFDFNFRPNIWAGKVKDEKDEEKIKEKARLMAKNVFKDFYHDINIMLVSNLDLEYFLDIDKAVLNDPEKLEEAFFSKYPNCKYLVVRNRNKLTPTHNNVEVAIYTNTNEDKKALNKYNYYKSPVVDFDVEEAIGGGDAFTAAILYRIYHFKDQELEDTVKFAIETFIVKHHVSGDYLHDISAKDIYNGVKKNVNKKNILIATDKIDADFKAMRDRISLYANCTLVEGNPESLVDIDIFVGKRLTKKQLDSANKLKAIFAYKTGVDDFPLELIDKMKIKLYNSHVDSKIIAQYAVSMAMSLTSRVTEFDKKLRDGVWYDEANPYWKSFFDLKVGLLGYGQIGQAINKILRDNGIETYTIKRGNQSKYQFTTPVDSIEELISKTDMLILSLPKTDETDHILNERTISLMKDMYVVNVGRSNAIDEASLYQALKLHHLKGAAIDTWVSKAKPNEKKLPSIYPFHELDNVILSPHQAMKIEEGHAQYVTDTTNNVITYIETGTSPNQIDLKKGY